MREIELNKPIKHLAIIMDGNGRWAKERGLPRTLGHKEACNRIVEIFDYCADYDIKVISLYAFSTENWKRPKSEIKFLFQYLEIFFKREMDKIMKDGFQHNLQSIRVATIIENMNLTYETLDGIKHHSGDLFSKEIPMASTLEGQIVKVADKIAYINHDIDDATRGDIISESDIPSEITNALGHSKSERIDTLVKSVVKSSVAY